MNIRLIYFTNYSDVLNNYTFMLFLYLTHHKSSDYARK